MTLESAHAPTNATKRENRQPTRSAAPARSATPGDRMAAMVSRIGNWNANALLRDRAIGAPSCPADAARAVGVQAKLSMSRPGDPDEHEADRIADHIMASSKSAATSPPCPTCAASGSSCPKCGEDKKIQRTALPGAGQVSGAPALGLGGAGVPLDAPIRAFFEPHFGVDLANVRVHTDDAADRATTSIGARAFTLGSDIAFARNQFAPETTNGKHLLAHELTHVIQQSQTGSPDTSAQQPIRPQLTTPPKVQGAWYDFAVDAAEWVGGEVAEGAEAAWSGAKRVGGWVKDEAVRVGGAAWECFKVTGSSIGDLVTGHLPNPRQLLNMPEPADDSPIGVMDVIMALLQHPCVRMIPGYPIFAAAASKLPEIYAFLKGAWAIVKDPDRVTSAMQGALAPMMSDVAGHSREQVENALALNPALRKHLAGIWRHLEPKLLEFGQNWWEILKQTAWDLIWPWDGVGGDLAAIWETLKKTGSDIWAFDIDSAADDILAVWREANQLIGRLYGWFAIASILIGAILGAIFGGGVGAIPGAMAGAEFALAVGEGLLISTVAAEGLTITKAVFDLASGEQSDKKNEDDYELIANSSIVLGITGVMIVLGAIAARFARGVISRVAGKIWPRAAEVPVPGAPRPAEPAPGAPRPAEPAPGAPRPAEPVPEAPRPAEPAPVPEGELARGPAEGEPPAEEPGQGQAEDLFDGMANEDDIHLEDLEGPNPGEQQINPAICFPAGTPVWTPHGQQPIESIRVGDTVWSFDDEKGCVISSVVENLVRGKTRRWVDVQLSWSDCTPADGLRATPSHRLWVESRQEWRAAADLVRGDLLRTRSGACVRVECVCTVEVDEQETFNLSVEGTECYFAGALAVLAHNITASRLAWLQRPGFRNYTLVDANGTVYYSGMFGPNTTPAEVRARHAANHDRFNPSKSENIDGKNVGGDDMVIEPGTREYGEARILENQLAVEHETINRSKPETYRCNRQQPLADAKVQEYGEYLRFKETCG